MVSNINDLIRSAAIKYLTSTPPPGKTEDDFNAHITALATSGVTGWEGNSEPGSWITTVGIPAGFMFGSSWISLYWTKSANARALQHAMPSPAVFNALAAGQRLFFRTEARADVLVWTGRDRNGYSSLNEDDGIPDPSLRMMQYIRWDRTLNKAFTGDPASGTAETEYTW